MSETASNTLCETLPSDRQAPARSTTIAEGLTALYGIQAVPNAIESAIPLQSKVLINNLNLVGIKIN